MDNKFNSKKNILDIPVKKFKYLYVCRIVICIHTKLAKRLMYNIFVKFFDSTHIEVKASIVLKYTQQKFLDQDKK